MFLEREISTQRDHKFAPCKEDKMTNCSSCGTIVPSAMASCPKCGAAVTNRPPANPTPSGIAPPGHGSGTHVASTAAMPRVPVASAARGYDHVATWPGSSATPPYAIPGAPGTAVATGPQPPGGWTGIPGVVAFGVSIICVQAWAGIGYGLLITFIGNAFSSLSDSSNGYCDYWKDCSETNDAADGVMIAGIVLIAISVILLISVIGLMRGIRAGQVFCVIVESLLIVLAVGVGAQLEDARYVVVGALFPTVALICIVTTPANRLIQAAEMASRTGRRG